MEYKFKYYGSNKSCNMIKKSAKADTMLELYNELVNQDIISEVDYNPYFKGVLNKANLRMEDFEEYEDFEEWYSENCTEYDLTEKEIALLIVEEIDDYSVVLEKWNGEEYISYWD